MTPVIDPYITARGSLVFHASGPVEGGWGVLDFWESRADFDAFGPRIRTSVEAAGVALEGPPDIKEFPVHETYAG